MPQHDKNDVWIQQLRATGETQAQALGELRDLLMRRVRASFLPRGVDDAFCEDVVQDAMVKILDKLDQFEGRSQFTTWATSIAVRSAISALRRRQFQNVSLDQPKNGEPLRIEIPDRAQTPAEQAEWVSMLETLRELIASELSKKQRLAIQALLSGMPVEEIAARTDSNRNAVYKLIHDGRQRLKSGLESAGYRWPDVASLVE